jgi:predicted acylesterase/phospholipase RssA
MGAMMAGCIASGLSPTEILAKIEEVSNTNFLKDYDLPYSSILNPKSYELAMQIYAGSSRVFIEDLWIPMFCCATNLSKSHLEVIDTGLLWKAIRASGTVPGVHPPMVKGKSLLVDGGLINNLPGDILLKKFGGKLLSVNVSPEADLIPNFDVYPNQKNYAFNKVLFKNMFRKDYLDLNVPTIVNIMLRSIMVGSSHKSNEVADLSDVYLRPPVFHFAMGDLDKAEEIAQIGYEYTINKLNRVQISELLKK